MENVITLIIRILLLGILTATAYFDARIMKIPIWLPALGFAAGLILQLIQRRRTPLDLLAGCAIGGILLLISKASRKAIGTGDGLVFISSGMLLGLVGNVFLLLFSLGLAALFSAFMLILKKRRWKDTFPFMPFVLGGYIILLSFSHSA